MKAIVTGGCGFIGSNFIQYLLEESDKRENIEIINIDKITYAGRGKNIEHLGLSQHKNYHFIQTDILNSEFVEYIISKEKPDIIFNFAAETHVDNSIMNSNSFEHSNIIGARNIFNSAIKNKIKKFVQISTDEVYGSIKEGSFSEESPLNPSSPYSASKAAADLIALSYYKTHKFPVIITRSANNYGNYQFPEKVLPLFITNLIEGKKIPLMWSEENPGLNVRDWLNVKDNCRAIWLASQNGEEGNVYNIPGENEISNIDMTKMLLSYFGYEEDMIEKIPHREAHDFRYSILGHKIKRIGFKHSCLELKNEFLRIVNWYKENENWWKPLKNCSPQNVLVNSNFGWRQNK